MDHLITSFVVLLGDWEGGGGGACGGWERVSVPGRWGSKGGYGCILLVFVKFVDFVFYWV